MKVALGGDGADELFAGYINFPANRFAHALARVPGWAGRLARRLLAAVPHNSSYMSLDFLLRQLSQGAGVPPERQWVACMAPFAPEELDELWLPEALAAAAAGTEDPVAALLAHRAPQRWSTAELIHAFATVFLPEDILQKVDRGSMYASLEVRAPYLGRAFAEYAMSLPSTDKIRGFSRKRLLKKLALRHIPREIVEQPKHGFAVPLARLLRGPLRERVADVILASNGPLADWFRRETIERLWRSIRPAGATTARKSGRCSRWRRRCATPPRLDLARLDHIQFPWKLNVVQLLYVVAFSDGKPVPTFPENALSDRLARQHQRRDAERRPDQRRGGDIEGEDRAQRPVHERRS